MLAYDVKNDKEEHVNKRNIFEERLQKVGLILEQEKNQRIHFVKIHVPVDVIAQYAELLKIRMPIKSVYNISLIHISSRFE